MFGLSRQQEYLIGGMLFVPFILLDWFAGVYLPIPLELPFFFFIYMAYRHDKKNKEGDVDSQESGTDEPSEGIQKWQQIMDESKS
ncbi:MAG: hypothetical protein ABEI97_04595 [Candidatus Nanohaloarchaea archaeon]